MITDSDPLAAEFAAIDAALARSDAALAGIGAGHCSVEDRDPLIYDLDWDEGERLEEWRTVLNETDGLPSVLRTIIVLDAWNTLQVLQHAPWLGRLLAAAILRQAGPCPCSGRRSAAWRRYHRAASGQGRNKAGKVMDLCPR